MWKEQRKTMYVFLLILSVCIYHSFGHNAPWNSHNQGYPYKQAIPQDVMVDVINYLGLSLLDVHNENNNNNIAISPYGAVSVLVSIGEGLRGSAGYEIQNALNLPDDISVIRVGLRDVHRHLKSYFIPKEGFLAGLTLNKDNVTLNTKYEEILKFYGYDIESFNNPLYTEPSYTTTLISITRTPDLDGMKTTTNKSNENDGSTTNNSSSEEIRENTGTSTTESTSTVRLETTTISMDTTLEPEKRMDEKDETTVAYTTTESTTQPSTVKTTMQADIVSTIQNTMTTEIQYTLGVKDDSEESTTTFEFKNGTETNETSEEIKNNADKRETSNKNKEALEMTTNSPVSVATKKPRLTKRTTKLSDEIYIVSTEPMTPFTEDSIKHSVETTAEPKVTTVRGPKPFKKESTKKPFITTYKPKDNSAFVTTMRPSTIPTDFNIKPSTATENSHKIKETTDFNIKPSNVNEHSNEMKETSLESYEESYEDSKEDDETGTSTINEITTQAELNKETYITSVNNFITSYTIFQNIELLQNEERTTALPIENSTSFYVPTEKSTNAENVTLNDNINYTENYNILSTTDAPIIKDNLTTNVSSTIASEVEQNDAYQKTTSKYFMTTYHVDEINAETTINLENKESETSTIQITTKEIPTISTTYLPTTKENVMHEDSITTQIIDTTQDSNDQTIPTKNTFENTIPSADEMSVFDQKDTVIYATDTPRPFTLSAENTTLTYELTPPKISDLETKKYVEENWPTPPINQELTPPETTVQSFRKQGLNINNWSNRTDDNITLNTELIPPSPTESTDEIYKQTSNFQQKDLISSTLDIEVGNISTVAINKTKRNKNSGVNQENDLLDINRLYIVSDPIITEEPVPPLISTSIITEKDKVNAYIETNGASQISIKIENQFEKIPSVTVENLRNTENDGLYDSDPKVIVNGVLKNNNLVKTTTLESPYEGTTLKAIETSKGDVSFQVEGIPQVFLSDEVSKYASQNSNLSYVIDRTKMNSSDDKAPSRISLTSLVDGKRKLTKRDTPNVKNVTRSTRSIVDYIIARYYDNRYVANERFSPHGYEPETDFNFLVNGKYREPNVNFMTYDAVLPFCFVPSLNALALSFPLDSPKYYLLLLLPTKDDGVDDLVRNLRRMGSLRRIISNLKSTHVKAQIPSFMLKGYVVLTPSLQKLGIIKIFEPRQSDFTPMTKDKDTYVTNIEQAVTVTIRNYVDQEHLRNYRNLHQHGPVEFKADHPFLYFVLDTEINVTLMAGKIINPLNSRIR